MKLTAQDNIQKKTWEVGIEPIDTYGSINASLGMMKGDLIIYAGDGDPRRFSAGSTAGKVIMTDPTSTLGWVLSDPGGVPTVQLKNDTGGQVAAGRVVMLKYSSNTPSFDLATVSGTQPLYITAEDSGHGDTIGCYGLPGMIVPVMCTGTFNRGDGIKVTKVGVGGKSSASPGTIGIAVQAKSSTVDELIKVLLTGTGAMSSITGNEDKVITFSGTSLTASNDYEHRNGSAINSLAITLPASPTPLFRCTVSFSSGSSFSGVTFKKGTASYTVKNVGHALNKKSVRYNLSIWWDGAFYWCSTKAV